MLNSFIDIMTFPIEEDIALPPLIATLIVKIAVAIVIVRECQGLSPLYSIVENRFLYCPYYGLYRMK
jgi:hypothetical protein